MLYMYYIRYKTINIFGDIYLVKSGTFRK